MTVCARCEQNLSLRGPLCFVEDTACQALSSALAWGDQHYTSGRARVREASALASWWQDYSWTAIGTVLGLALMAMATFLGTDAGVAWIESVVPTAVRGAASIGLP